MKTIFLAAAAGWFIAAFNAAAQDAYVIERVNLIPMTSETVLKKHSVLIEGGKISAICERRKDCARDGAVAIDGRGKFLIPGLADMHVHIDYAGVDETSSDADIAAAHRTQDQQLRQYLTFGVTTVREMKGGPSTLRARDEINAGARLGPRIFTSWVLMGGDPPIHGGATPFGTPEAAAAFVDRTAADGYDMVKTYSALSPAVFDAIMATAREHGLVVGGHLPMQVAFEQALQAGMRSVEHASGFDMACSKGEAEFRPVIEDVYQGWAHCTPNEIADLAAIIAKYDVWNVPTLIVVEGVNTDYQRYADVDPDALKFTPPRRALNSSVYYDMFPARVRAAFQGTRQTRLAIVKSLSDAGAPLLIGTDTNPSGYNVHQELALFVEAGLTPYQALEAATAEPARYLDREGEFGTVVDGAIADLVLLDANPLEDIANARRISGVMVRGEWLPAERLAAMREEIFAEYAKDEAALAGED